MSVATQTPCSFYILCPHCTNYLGPLFQMYKALEIIQRSGSMQQKKKSGKISTPVMSYFDKDKVGPMKGVLDSLQLKDCCRMHLLTTMTAPDYTQF